MAPETATSLPEPKRAEAAAAGAPASVWRSCRLICLIFAARLYCCAPPSLAEETWPWALRKATTDKQAGKLRLLFMDKQKAAVERFEDVPHSNWEGRVADNKEGLVSKSEFFNALRPASHNKTWHEPLLDPTLENGELKLKKIANKDDERASLARSPYNKSKGANLEAMDKILETFQQYFHEGEQKDFAPFFADKARRVLSNGLKLSSMARAATAGRLSANVQRSSDGKINLKLSFPKGKRKGAIFSSQPLSWDYSASFMSDSNGLTKLEDSLTLKEKGDADKDDQVGNWIHDEKITRILDKKSPTACYKASLKCFKKWSQKELKYEYTWERETDKWLITKNTFVAKVYTTPEKPTSDRSKATWLRSCFKDDSCASPTYHSQLVDSYEKIFLGKGKKFIKGALGLAKLLEDTTPEEESIDSVKDRLINYCFISERGTEMIDGWTLHDFFIEEQSEVLRTSKDWKGTAWTSPSYVFTGLDKMPIDAAQSYGVCRIYDTGPESGKTENEVLTDYIRYGFIKTSPSLWDVSVRRRDLANTPDKLIVNDFSCTSKHLGMTASSETDDNPDEAKKVGIIKDIFAFPFKNIFQENDKKLSQPSGVSCNNPNCSSKVTSYKHMALNGTLFLLTAFTLLALVNLLKSRPKVRKEFRGVGSTTRNL